ncbi:ABC transporter substrate-binding protein [Paenibacillus solisilvae]|uniref:ABC transporter substrate-binding protein n=1 Tax=Paenibacillus solisilvae TaxID=2486751 RepID=A0ABW0VW62_9BACL
MAELTGCGSSPSSNPTEMDLNKPKEAYKGEIVFWSWDVEHEKKIIEDFNKEYPNIHVRIIPVQDYQNKLLISLATGSGAPDVVQLEENSAAAPVQSGKFVDLSKPPYNFDKSSLPGFLVKRYSDKKGQFVGIPNSINPAAMYYRRDLAKQYLGTDDPEEVGKLIGAGEGTWDKFFEVGRKLKEDSKGEIALLPGLGDFFNMLSKQPKGAWHEGNKLLINENILPEFKLLEQIRKEGLDAKLQQWSPSWNTSYSQGKVLFYPGAAWYKDFLISMNDKDGNGRWGVAGNPVANWAWGGSAECIPLQSKHKDLAFQFIRWWTTSKEGGQSFFKHVGALPFNSDYLSDPLYNQPEPVLGGEIMGAFWKSNIQGIDVPAQDPNDGIANDAINQGVGKIHSGTATAEEAAKLVIEKIEAKLPEYHQE